MLALLLALSAHAHDVEIRWSDDAVHFEDVETGEVVEARLRTGKVEGAKRRPMPRVVVRVEITDAPNAEPPSYQVAVEALDPRDGTAWVDATLSVTAGHVAELLTDHAPDGDPNGARVPLVIKVHSDALSDTATEAPVDPEPGSAPSVP